MIKCDKDKYDGSRWAVFEFHADQAERGDVVIWRETYPYTDDPKDRNHGDYNSIAVEDIIAVTRDNDVYAVLFIEHIPSEQTTPGFVFRLLTAINLPESFRQEFPPIMETPSHLTCPPGPNNEQNIHVLISTGSGTGRAASFFDNVVQPTLEALNISENAYRVHHTRSSQTIRELTRSIFLPRAQEGIRQTLILLSGDGGVHEIVNELLSSGVDNLSTSYQAPAIGLLALGTGNAIAHSLELTRRSSSLGLREFLEGTPRPFSLFHVHFSPGAKILTDEGRTGAPIPTAPGDGVHGVIYGAVVLSYGLHASLVAESDTPEYRKHGSQRFQMAAEQLLSPPDASGPHVYKAKVSMLRLSDHDREEWIEIPRQEHAYILNTLVSDLQENFTISPSSHRSDGQMYLVHFGPMSGANIMRLMTLASQGGKHIEDESVGYEEVEGVRIEVSPEEEEERWRRVCVDGTIVRLEKGGWVEVRKVDAEPCRKNERVIVQLVQP
ncbi:MAG: hypothetical protein M1816_004932 [Peltula sp. TS41687]|nr:MAG: hypothetical protein M1816_004932 [Peltula sp. TS41687]